MDQKGKGNPTRDECNQKEKELLEVFEKVYYRKGKVVVVPDFVEPKVKLFTKVIPKKPPPPPDKSRNSQRSKGQKTPTETSETLPRESVHASDGSQHQGGQRGRKVIDASSEGTPQHASGNTQDPDKQLECAASSDGQNRNKKKKIKEPTSYVLDEEKMKGKGVQTQMKSEECEFLVLQRIEEAMAEITGPEDPPVLILHNQDLVVKVRTDTSEGEKDVLVLHPTLGVLVLEVKGTETTKIYTRFDKATTQLLHAQASIQEEMGDLLEEGAVVLTIALPNLQPGDSKIIRQEAQTRKELKQKSGVTTEGAKEKEGKCTKDSRGGNDAQKIKVMQMEHLEDHPEVLLVCGSIADVYTEWVLQLQEYRASTRPAFKGSTEEERLKRFKQACARRCSVAKMRPGQTVKDMADLHHRFLLTKEQLQVRDSEAELLHISGPPGSGKTLLLGERARRWVREERPLAVAVGSSFQDMLLRHLVRTVCGKEADPSKVSTHNSTGELLQKLLSVSPDHPVSVILDEALAPGDLYLYLLDCVREGSVRALWTADTRPLAVEVEAELRDLQGTTVHLSQCLRCPSSVISWVNCVRGQEESLLEHPQVPVTKELGVGVEVISHFDHPHRTSSDLCPSCRGGVLTFFSSLGLPRTATKPALSWSDVVVITMLNMQRQRVARWLRGLGIPAVSERNTLRERAPLGVPLPGATLTDAVEEDKEAARERVMSGKDREGRKALHVVLAADFRGLERPVVVLWHEDWEDQDKDRQRQALRDSTFLMHRQFWFQAASRCQGRLLVVATTPSPALSLLPGPQPRVDFSAFKTTLLFHHRHRQKDLPYWQCGECGTPPAAGEDEGTHSQWPIVSVEAGVSRGGSPSGLQSLGLPLCGSPAPDLCKQALVVLSGCSCNGDRVAAWLRGLGIPAVFEEPLRDTLALEHYDPSAVEGWRARVEAGVDASGKPAIHVVRNLTHLVPPRQVVLLVHHDRDDSDPEQQSQARRDSRLWSHGVFWQQAASLCQKHFVVLATTPSPFLSTAC